MQKCLTIIILFASLFAKAQNNLIPVHDPVIIKQDSLYYIFCTGRGISVWSSKDLKIWTKEKPVFETPPQWTVDSIPSFKNYFWAPDISFHNNQYYLFYAVSVFGKNTSCIGVAINKTLNSSDTNYKWMDKGMIVQSIPGKTNFNAIDPNVFIDGNQPYLTFGSFWGGIELIKLSKDLLKPVADYKIIASRKKFPEEIILNNGAGNAIEAPFIFKKNSKYYLFASVDYCCKGKESTYKMIVGKASNIEGPYVDKDGKLLTEGGGTIVLKGNDDWYGVGHNAVANFDGIDYIIFHGYDAKDNGKSKLRIEKLHWDNQGWPFIIQ
jgi:arabinan endo-1,5-alpha-L-arabinosidase